VTGFTTVLEVERTVRFFLMVGILTLLVEQRRRIPQSITGYSVRSIELPKHSHMSESYAIGTADTQLSDQILEFIKTGK